MRSLPVGSDQYDHGCVTLATMLTMKQGPYYMIATGGSDSVLPAGTVTTTLVPAFSAQYWRLVINSTLTSAAEPATLGDVRFSLTPASICDGTWSTNAAPRPCVVLSTPGGTDGRFRVRVCSDCNCSGAVGG